MRYAIIADIHANLAAFKAVLADIGRQGGVDRTWCLGDVVDYGPEPHECIELLRQMDHVCVAGNHDWAAIGKISTDEFNPHAADATQWTSLQLNADDAEYLAGLPLVIKEGDFTLVHGSPRHPIREYLVSTTIAEENLALFESRFCLVGHSHIPLVFSYQEKGACSVSRLQDNADHTLGQDRLIINPGSVGQPRDHDPRASYAIYDSTTRAIHLHRIPYDVRATQTKMVEAGLPLPLAERLSYGW